jgi:hypothetical protein
MQQPTDQISAPTPEGVERTTGTAPDDPVPMTAAIPFVPLRTALRSEPSPQRGDWAPPVAPSRKRPGGRPARRSAGRSGLTSIRDLSGVDDLSDGPDFAAGPGLTPARMSSIELLRSLQDFAPRGTTTHRDLMGTPEIIESIDRLNSFDMVSSGDLIASLEEAAEAIVRQTSRPEPPTMTAHPSAPSVAELRQDPVPLAETIDDSACYPVGRHSIRALPTASTVTDPDVNDAPGTSEAIAGVVDAAAVVAGVGVTAEHGGKGPAPQVDTSGTTAPATTAPADDWYEREGSPADLTDVGDSPDFGPEHSRRRGVAAVGAVAASVLGVLSAALVMGGGGSPQGLQTGEIAQGTGARAVGDSAAATGPKSADGGASASELFSQAGLTLPGALSASPLAGFGSLTGSSSPGPAGSTASHGTGRAPSGASGSSSGSGGTQSGASGPTSDGPGGTTGAGGRPSGSSSGTSSGSSVASSSGSGASTGSSGGRSGGKSTSTGQSQSSTGSGSSSGSGSSGSGGSGTSGSGGGGGLLGSLPVPSLPVPSVPVPSLPTQNVPLPSLPVVGTPSAPSAPSTPTTSSGTSSGSSGSSSGSSSANSGGTTSPGILSVPGITGTISGLLG